MKKAILLLLLTFYFQLLTLHAQVLKVTSDTSHTECWGAGGPCQFNFTIHLSPYNKDIVFNYLYLGGLMGPLNPHNGSLQVDTVNNTYTIRAAKSVGLVGPCQHYSGEAMITYTYKGKTDSIIIQHFVQGKAVNHIK
jgi:hypothetical protein